MPLKALVTTLLIAVTTLGSRLSKDTSMADTILQMVTIKQLQEIVDQIIDNNKLLKEKVNKMGLVQIKLLFIKRFAGERLKLKEFLTQMHFKIL